MQTDRQYVEEKKNILAKKWEKIEDESRQKKDLHYQDVIFDEARSHGVSFMTFSRDEKEREAQHNLLKGYRTETITASAFNAEESKKKKKQMDERLRKIRDKKRLKLGYPIIEHEDDPSVTPPLSDEEDGDSTLKVTEPLVLSPNVQENVTDGISSKLRKIREWDLGKPNIDNRVMSQEEWTESRRKMRDKEFAPPKLYSDRIESKDHYKNRKSLLNRLKASPYKSDTEVRSNPYSRNHQNSIYNRLNYNTDSHTSKTTEYPDHDGTFNPKATKEFDGETITQNRSWDRSNAWTRNKEMEYPKFWSENVNTEIGSSGTNKDIKGFDSTMNIDSYPETENTFGQNVSSRFNDSHDTYAFGDQNKNANSMFDRTWDPSYRGAEFDKPSLPERNSEIVKSEQPINNEANIYSNKDYEFGGASVEASIDPVTNNDNKNVDDGNAPVMSKRWSSNWDQERDSKIYQSYDSNLVSQSDGKNPMLNSDNSSSSLVDMPSQHDNSWDSNKSAAFHDYEAHNSTENSWIDQARDKNRMRHGSSEFRGGWGPSRSKNFSNTTDAKNESSDLAKAFHQYPSTSVICNSSKQRKVPEFHEAVQNREKRFDGTWSSNRNSSFDQVEHTELGSEKGPKSGAEKMESFNAYKFNETPVENIDAECNEFSHKEYVDKIGQCEDVELDARDLSWGSNENLAVVNSRGQNINREFGGGSWDPRRNADFNEGGNKNENLDVTSSSSKNMGFDKAWTPSRSAELDQTFSRFRNTSGGSADNKWSTNRYQSSDFSTSFGQRNSTDFFPHASSSSFRWTKPPPLLPPPPPPPPPQQDSVTIEQAISDGLMKLRKEFDNTPVLFH